MNVMQISLPIFVSTWILRYEYTPYESLWRISFIHFRMVILEFQWRSTQINNIASAEKALWPTSKSGRMDFANAMCEVVRRPLKSTSLTLPVGRICDCGCRGCRSNKSKRYKITFANANVPYESRGHICSMTNYNDKLLWLWYYEHGTANTSWQQDATRINKRKTEYFRTSEMVTSLKLQEEHLSSGTI